MREHNASNDSALQAIVAEYESEDALANAIEHTRRAGYRELDALLPFGSERIVRLLEVKRPPTWTVALLGAALFGLSALFALDWMRAVDYPLDVGGRPLHAWPAYVPITLELSFLGGALAATAAFAVLCRFPATSNALLTLDAVARASRDRYFLVIDRAERRFDPAAIERDLAETHPIAIHHVGALS